MKLTQIIMNIAQQTKNKIGKHKFMYESLFFQRVYIWTKISNYINTDVTAHVFKKNKWIYFSKIYIKFTLHHMNKVIYDYAVDIKQLSSWNYYHQNVNEWSWICLSYTWKYYIRVMQ